MCEHRFNNIKQVGGTKSKHVTENANAVADGVNLNASAFTFKGKGNSNSAPIRTDEIVAPLIGSNEKTKHVATSPIRKMGSRRSNHDW